MLFVIQTSHLLNLLFACILATVIKLYSKALLARGIEISFQYTYRKHPIISLFRIFYVNLSIGRNFAFQFKWMYYVMFKTRTCSSAFITF